MKIKEINTLLSSKSYTNAIENIHNYLTMGEFHDNGEFLSFCLDIIFNICDKSEITIEYTLKIAPLILNHSENWIRQDSLIILSKIYPMTSFDQFLLLIESCESKLFDPDKKVRESAVTLISQILKRSFSQYPELYVTYAKMFEDDSWKVRARALEGALEFLSPETEPPEEMILIFNENLLSLFQDPDEEIRGLAAEVFKKLCFHMNSDQIVMTLLPLLKDEDWEIREKTIWIVGEIGNLFFHDFHPLFEQLISLFSDEIMMIQTKTIDAFVKIGKTHGPELLPFFINTIVEIDRNGDYQDLEDGISESLIFITLQNMKPMISLLIDELMHPKEKIRHLIANFLLKIYMEKSDGFEEELFRMFQSINPNDWRQRKKTIRLLGDLSFVLHIESIAVWTTINLRNWLESEKDLDVLDEIESSLAKINNVFDNIDEEIEDIERRKRQFYENLNSFQDLTTNMRTNTEDLIAKKRFFDAEVYLEEEGNKISEKLDSYEIYLQDSDFKRFSVDVIQDFKDIKEEVLESISDIKNIMYNDIMEQRSDYLEELNLILADLKQRIESINDEYHSIKNLEDDLKNFTEISDPLKIEQFLDCVSLIREHLSSLEFDIGQTWLSNLEFKEFLKEVTIFWVDIKIEIQQYLGDMYQRFRLLQSELMDSNTEYSELKRKITFDFLNNNLQNIIIQAVQSQRDVLERFDLIVEPINKEIRSRQFKDARHLVELTINNIYTSLEHYNKEISTVYKDIDQINLPSHALESIKKYLDNWSEVKDELLGRIHKYKNDVEDQILVEEIKEYLKYMNPIPLEKLSNVLSMDLQDLKDRLFGLLHNHSIFAEIRQNELIQPERPLGENLLSFFRKVEIIGNKISFSLRLYNPTKFFINDIGLLFLFPEFLKLNIAESDPTDIKIREFEPEAIRILHWHFRMEKVHEKKYELKKWLLNVSYRNPFDKIITFQKEMDIIL